VWLIPGVANTTKALTCGSGHYLGRDLSAAKSILTEGLKIYGKRNATTRVEGNSDYLGSTSYET